METIKNNTVRSCYKRKIWVSIFLFIWSFAILAFFHKRSFSSSLRYTRIAEGNISQAVHALFERGFAAYKVILKGDAEEWGRVRPVHWLYYSVPFFVSMARNGDLFWHDNKVPIRERFNGDLQTHVLFLIVSLAIASGCMIWLSYRIGCPLWIAILFPLYLALSESLSENLLVFYSDSQEIPQLLFLSLYFIGIRQIFSGRVPNRKQELFATVSLLLAYGTKETTLVVFPIISIFLLIKVFMKNTRQKAFIYFSARHIGIHLLFSSLLVIAIITYRSGAYVSQNYLLNLDFHKQIIFAFNALSKGAPVLRLLIVGTIMAVALFIFERIMSLQAKSNDKSGKNLAWIYILSIALFIAFVLIYLPWRVRMVKYYLPALFFGAWSATLVQGLVFQKLANRKLYVGAILWVVGTSLFMLKDIDTHRNKLNYIYRYLYDDRKSVPFISRDIAESINDASQPYHFHIIAGQSFQEGVLPFVRYLNHVYDINILFTKRN